MEINGQLEIGYQDDQGCFHKTFTMRLATLEDIEKAIEAAGIGASTARIRRYEWSRTLTQLGSFKDEEITPEMLATLASTEFGILEDAQETLRGKLKAVSNTSKNIEC